MMATKTIRANSKGLVYVTITPMSPSDTKNNLFMGGYGEYAEKGEYVMVFNVNCDVNFEPGTQPNELIHFGSLRYGRQITQIIYFGINDFK